jgi:O-methyltransferase
MTDVSTMYLDLLKKCLLDDVYKVQKNLANNALATDNDIENGMHWPERAHTMIGRKRMENIRYCLQDVLKNNIEGDLIETGVWRGGACIFMKGILKTYNSDKKVFVADSFEGLPPPDPKYPADRGDNHHTIKILAVSLEEVTQNFRRYDLLDENVVFIKGFFETSIPRAPINKLSILRLDGDMYSSTIQVLESLYDKVSVGGYIIVDDWCLPNCKRAVIDFRTTRKIMDEIIEIDGVGVFWKKT